MARSIALSLLVLAAAVEARPNRGPFKKIAVIRLREEASEAIDPSVKTSVLRRIEQIREWGADCVVLDIESYGGLVTASMETADEIYSLGRSIHTIAYVHRKAFSGAAMLSISCQEIVMNEVARIGDSQVIYLTPGGEVKEGLEKQQGPVATTFETYARGNGYPVPLTTAMVRKEIGVWRFRMGDGEWRYYATNDEGELPDSVAGRQGGEIVVHPGRLATFGAAEAVEYGICSRMEPSLDALIASLRAPDAMVRSFDWTWAERASRWLLGIRALLFLVGAGALYLALKTPGTGIPELIAVIAFGLFFGASAIAGFSGAIELILFFLGMVLIGVEIFLLPGLGVAGLAGLALVLTSIALAAIPVTNGGDLPSPASVSYYLLPMARDFLIGTIGAAVLVMFLVRHLPKVPYLRNLVLEAPAPVSVSSPQPPPRSLVGERGLAVTHLRPAGSARIGGERVDVVTEGAFVEPDTPVRVVDVQGNRVVVRPEPRDA